MERVFYSWQSDSPGSTNRNLIYGALEKATEELRNDETITIYPVIDRDTLGLLKKQEASLLDFGQG